MNKLFVTTILASFVLAASLAAVETKQQKIEQLFELTNDKQMLIKIVDPIFINSNIIDEKVKKEAMDKFFATLKHDYVTAYDTFFSEVEIDEMLKYYSSATGKHFMSAQMELGSIMQKAYCSIMTIIQDLLNAQEKEKSAQTIKSTSVIHFDELAKGKNDAEIRELFNKEIQHDGLTVVKFSAVWCGPCKNYA